MKDKMINKKYVSGWLTALGIATVSLGSLVTMVQPALADNYQWVAGRSGSVPKYAIGVGNDLGDTLYVCRANNTNGKLHPKYGKCYIPYGGKEQEFTTYEVFVGPSSFEPMTGSIPPNAIVSGSERNGDPLYICMASLGDITMPGKYSAVNKVCYLPYGGKEHEVRSPIWIATSDPTSVASGNFILSGKSLYSNNKNYEFIMQTDGNLVLYDRRGGKRSPIWSSGTPGNRRAVALMAGSNLVVLSNDNNNTRIWSNKSPSGTSGSNSKLVVQDDGNVVIYIGRKPVWTTNTVSK